MYAIHPAICLAATLAAIGVPPRLSRPRLAIGYKPLTDNAGL